ncbi:MBL fold metallo-hydrolase [Carnobacterium divergens]|nr:MBL fold metallo-hydrolase [Carnobacterium divergens]MDT1997290.1 MBL fold metallo-hydrolase [Carnobacterium divergens]
MIHIEKIPNGSLQENCYIIADGTDALIIDPGSDAERIIDTIHKLNVIPQAILLTHTHHDHIGAVDQVRDAFSIPVYVHELEQDWLNDPEMNLSAQFTTIPVTARPAEFEFTLYQEYHFGKLHFTVVPTPGHSFGSVSFIFNDFVIAGDALFKGSVGRPDLPTGNLDQLLTAIKTELFSLPPETVVYPGHGDETTIAQEQKNNPYFN